MAEPVTITKEQLQAWSDEVKAGGITWAKIADREHISKSTLARRRMEFGMEFDMTRVVNNSPRGKLATVTKDVMQGLIDEYQAGKATWTDIAARYGVSLITMIDKRRRLGFAESYQGQTKSRTPRKEAKLAADPTTGKRAYHKRAAGPAPKIDNVEDVVVGLQIEFVAIVDGYATIILKGGGAIRITGHNIALSIVRRETLAAWAEQRQRQYRAIKDELRVSDRISGIVNSVPGRPAPQVHEGTANAFTE